MKFSEIQNFPRKTKIYYNVRQLQNYQNLNYPSKLVGKMI